jgi:hypothetical protein
MGERPGAATGQHQPQRTSGDPVRERRPIEVSGNESRIDGNATLTMVASRNARYAPNDDTSSTREAETRPR